jgi:hypothetical protein
MASFHLPAEQVVRCARAATTGCDTPDFVWSTAEPVPEGGSGPLQAAYRAGWRLEALSTQGRPCWWCPQHAPSRVRADTWAIDGLGVFSNTSPCPHCSAVDMESWILQPEADGGDGYEYRFSAGAHTCAEEAQRMRERRRLLTALRRELGL